MNRQRIEIDAGGSVAWAGVELDVMAAHDPRRLRLQELAGRIAAGLPGLGGYVGIDLVWHARRGPVVIEINPRVTSAYVGLAAALGRSIAAEIVADAFEPEAAP